MTQYKRILVKVSGEALSGGGFGVSADGVAKVAQEIASVAKAGVQVGVVVGGGNFWRGRTSVDMDRGIADNIGMLATVMNGLALCDALTTAGVKAKVVSAVNIDKIARTATIPEVKACLRAAPLWCLQAVRVRLTFRRIRRLCFARASAARRQYFVPKPLTEFTTVIRV